MGGTFEVRAIPDRRSVVAVVDDDRDHREMVASLLLENGFSSIALASIAEFVALGERPEVDLALIDLKLNGESGHTLALHIRAQMDLPIVMLTGRGDEIDRIIGLETVADDFITKPFNPRELLARIRAVLRRYGRASVMPVPAETAVVIGSSGLRIDKSRRQLLDAAGNEIPLTNSEYRLLEYFLDHPNRIIPRTELLSDLGSDLSHYGDRTIDVLILRLRRKIERVPSKPIHLQTRRTQGYIFVTSSASHA
ncbi:DNA-binding response regulator [Ensifer sp. LC13]|nr:MULTISPECIES: response regulator transcription factor [unclassified Ensifer]OCP03091.1 DNA-binding response regulator [Ensifer sp. LC14]OCP08210.1 DNA-binding response regulator [Ensifer sp. LC11]OCP08883.1 DNA-binding response regulator [Ensifer sp. LC13]OCP32253.1 DNA-binding response regulator [Ensifer sp. LC499]